MRSVIFIAIVCISSLAISETSHKCISGVYPHLAMYNNEAECGTGAVVPWAGRLWTLTYGPHLPLGSSDKLYEITPELEQIIRAESVGGTHANRMIHNESKQLIIGTYFIDEQRNVRVIQPKNMPGRMTGTARHLVDPQNRVYFGTMEEGLYDVNVNTLDVTGLIVDENPNNAAEEAKPAKIKSVLPGYHGKGLYTGQGRLIYANNGDRGPRVLIDPSVDSGALADWKGSGDWNLIRRNQFTDVSGPNGIYGAVNDNDPIWSIGWDHRSLILMLLDDGKWHAFRLPKASHSYDGAHGWHTEWPRIREINEDSLLMTMHGTFWKFPKTFSFANSAGISPRSNHLKIIGDFCYWDAVGKIVFGCDDTAKSEFTNKRKAKGSIAPPGQSQSNLWMIEPQQIDNFGPVIGRGCVWLNESVKANVPSDPMLFCGYDLKMLQLTAEFAGKFDLQIDEQGNGNWKTLGTLAVTKETPVFRPFTEAEKGVWIRLVPNQDSENVTAMFQYRNNDERTHEADAIFNGLAKYTDEKQNNGLLFARGANIKTLRMMAFDDSGELGLYDLDGDLAFKAAEGDADWMKRNFAIQKDVLAYEDSSILYVGEKGRWRIPYGELNYAKSPINAEGRVCREVCTERDLFNAGGTFFELPNENAEGFAKVRPIATHNRKIKDFVSYRGLICMSGISMDAPKNNPHIVWSNDGKCAVWVGVVDDLWKFGKARGIGGPWKNTAVKANEPSDPFLMTGYDNKRVTLSNNGSEAVNIRLEVDLTGTGIWVPCKTFAVAATATLDYAFPKEFAAYWVRAVSDKDTTASVTFFYE